MKRWLVALLALMLIAIPAFALGDEEDEETQNAGTGKAHDLVGKLGVGFNAQTIGLWFSTENAFTPYSAGVSVRYYFTDLLGMEASLGFGYYSMDVAKRQGDQNGNVDYSAMSLEPKVLFNFLSEEQSVLYAFGGLGLMQYKANDDTETGIRVSAGAGIQWFFSGLPNLGFSAEFGAMYQTMDDITFFGTFGGMLASFGLHYYFAL